MRKGRQKSRVLTPKEYLNKDKWAKPRDGVPVPHHYFYLPKINCVSTASIRPNTEPMDPVTKNALPASGDAPNTRPQLVTTAMATISLKGDRVCLATGTKVCELSVKQGAHTFRVKDPPFVPQRSWDHWHKGHWCIVGGTVVPGVGGWRVCPCSHQTADG